MKNSKIVMGLIGLVVLCGLFALLPLGCSQQPDTGGNNWREGGGVEPGMGWQVSGQLFQMDGATPASNVTCRLQETQARSEYYPYSETVISDNLGYYSFARVPMGNFTMTVSGNNMVAQTFNFTVSGTTTMNFSTYTQADWNTFMGSTGYPYDETAGYVIIMASFNGSPVSGAVADSVPSDYSAKGYITSTGSVDYNALTTTSVGKAFFYKLKAGQSYSFTTSKSGYNFPSKVGIKPVAGQIDTYVMTASTGPSVSPSPAAGVFDNPAASKKMAMGLMLMLALSCLVLLKKEK